MNQQDSGSRQFASSCVIASPKTTRSTAAGAVAIPVTNSAGNSDTGIDVEASNGVVHQITVRCSCDREHKIRLDYGTPREESSNG
ncbi:MAG: hypothetical protein AB8G99_24845 [Planctomycetaceae bacterium]